MSDIIAAVQRHLFADDLYSLLHLMYLHINSLIAATAMVVTVKVYLSHRDAVLIARQVEALAHCNRRYEEVSAHRRSVRDKQLSPGYLADGSKTTSDDAILDYFVNYWALQAMQFDYYNDGLIDYNTMMKWSVAKVYTFARNESVAGLDYRSSWALVSPQFFREKQQFFAYVQWLAGLAREVEPERLVAAGLERHTRPNRRLRPWQRRPR
ncbi:MAG: hypothetical protein P4L90_10580 [Rhodopila sp.]|nr:hypothetical protein [Rhodopila sp.]